jgi:deoxyribonuclease V
MLACVDVHYLDSGDTSGATIALVAFERWSDANAAAEWITRVPGDPAPYESGEFWKRELPYILTCLEEFERATEPARSVYALLVDGYVWLREGKPGLGAHLYEALGGERVVIGVAKRPFHGSPAIPVLRGGSRNPLYVTAAGLSPEQAAHCIRELHGPHRVPTLLKRADSLARGHVAIADPR